MHRRPLLILGTSGLAVEVAELAEQAGFEVVGFVQNLWPEQRGEALEGFRVYYLEELRPVAPEYWAVCAIGRQKRMEFIQQAEGLGLKWATLIHPRAVVSPRARLGEGCVVAAGAVIGTRTVLGRHVLVNRLASIGHDVVVEDFVFVGPGAVLSGYCRIGRGAVVGAGAVVRERIEVGAGAVVGAGACALNNVPERALLAAARSVKLE